MTRNARNNIGTVFFAFSLASIGSYGWLFNRYFSEKPNQPNQELGYIFQLSNHGAYVYLTDVESVGMKLLFWSAFCVGLIAFAIIPKEAIPVSQFTPRWIGYLGVRYNTDLQHPTRRQYALLVLSLASFVLFFYVFGPSIAKFAAKDLALSPK